MAEKIFWGGQPLKRQKGGFWGPWTTPQIYFFIIFLTSCFFVWTFSFPTCFYFLFYAYRKPIYIFFSKKWFFGEHFGILYSKIGRKVPIFERWCARGSRPLIDLIFFLMFNFTILQKSPGGLIHELEKWSYVNHPIIMIFWIL